MRNVLAAGERRSELAGGPGLAGGSFWIEMEWCRLGGGGKSATDCGESSGGAVVRASVFFRAETSFRRRSSSAVAAEGGGRRIEGVRNLMVAARSAVVAGAAVEALAAEDLFPVIIFRSVERATISAGAAASGLETYAAFNSVELGIT